MFRHHPLRSAGRLRPLQLAGKLLRGVHVQHAVCRPHLGLPHQDGDLGCSAGAHPGIWSVASLCRTLKKGPTYAGLVGAGWLCQVFPPLAPVPLWAGRFSSDRKNTILSGKYGGTRGGSDPLGDLPAHRPGPLVAHTPSNLHPTQTSGLRYGHAKRTHTHARSPLPHSTDSISAPRQRAGVFPLPPNSLCSVINRRWFHLKRHVSELCELCELCAPPWDCV